MARHHRQAGTRHTRTRVWAGLAAALLSALALTAGAEGEQAELPLSAWQQIRAAADGSGLQRPPSHPWGSLGRTVEGSFHKGLLSATLQARFAVLASSGWVEVPVLDAGASLRSVTLDGRPAALTRRGSMYVLGLSAPGVHTVQVDFLLGQEQERFARKLRFRVPPAGGTTLSLMLPEQDIEPRLSDGVLRSVSPSGEGTEVRGEVNASGLVELTWTRRPSHRGPQTLSAEARLSTLLSVHESLVTGSAELALSVLQGETDRVQLQVPEGLEVLQVEGPAVAQWQSRAPEGGEPGRLTILLRHLVADSVAARIRFQLPVLPEQPVLLGTVAPLPGTPVQGALGVRAPTGLRLRVQELQGAARVPVRDLPLQLTEMSDSPLLLGFTFEELPTVRLSVQRQQQVELTGTVVDELESSTVVLQDGSEVTKVKLHMRNNTRQYLRLRLPAGALLTHCLIDGEPVRPALAPPEAAALPGQTPAPESEALLLPLRQSERIEPGAERSHLVRSGDTLGALAGLYYADPGQWQRILEANQDQLASDVDLSVGQRLRIPRPPGVTVEEGRFVVELAYRRGHAPLGSFGALDLGLPTLDVDTLEVTWHLLLPHAVTPVHFGGNLRQYSAVRYDLFRRVRHFLQEAVGGGSAWAGEEYRSILSKRKGIYRAEAAKRSRADSVLATFPLVGRRYRFKRLLSGRERPQVRVRWVTPWVAHTLRWAALLLSLALAVLALRPGARWPSKVAAVVGLGLLAVLGHFVLGVHRRLVWGLDLGLLLVLLRSHGPAWLAGLRRIGADPARLRGLVSFRLFVGLGGCWILLRFMLAYPMLLSLLALVGLVVLRWRLSAGARPRSARSAVAASLAALALAAWVTGGAPRPAAAQQPRDQASLSQSFDALLAEADAPGTSVRPSATALPSGGGGQVSLSLSHLEELLRTAAHHEQESSRPREPAIVYGAAHYHGRAVPGALQLTLDLRLRLGRPGAYKTVPLVGDDVVVVSARNGGQALALARERGFHVWVTPEAGEVSLKLELLVPARGPRGSREYDFATVRAPVTRLTCRFAGAGLQPRLDSAVRTSLTSEGQVTVLDAVLEPGLRVHLLGLQDLGEGSTQPAKLYAESLNLLSIGDGAVDLFCVLRYTILYAGAKRFQVQIPAGLRVVSADGEGAFRYELQPSGDGLLLQGETAFPIRNHYEISLHLRRPLQEAGDELDVRLPRTLGVQREAGWLGVEVPGKLLLSELRRERVRAVDLRQLPSEVVRNAVSPILFAYRFHDPDLGLALLARHLPEQAVHSGSVDRLRAFSLLSPGGTLLTELRITLRNRLRHALALRLPEGSRVRSTLLDGEPVKASRDEQGRLLLPLKRSAGGARLRPFDLLVVTERQLDPVGLLGTVGLQLPAPDLPVSVAEWALYLPSYARWSEPRGPVELQLRAGSATWHAPPAAPAGSAAPRGRGRAGSALSSVSEASAEAGAMPVRIEVPRSGSRVDTARYWLAADQPLQVELSYLRSWVRYPLLLMLGLLTFGAFVLALQRRRARWIGRALAIPAALALLHYLGRPTLGLTVLGALALVTWRRGQLGRLPAAVGGWLRQAWSGWRRPPEAAPANALEPGEATQPGAGTQSGEATGPRRQGFAHALARVALGWGVVVLAALVAHGVWRVVGLLMG